MKGIDEDDKVVIETILRDFFAGMALAGQFAGGRAYKDQSRVDRAVMAYNAADAMIKERAKRINGTT